MSRLGTESAFEVLARARALEATGRDIVHLEIGEPDAPTPPTIVRAGLDALARGETRYTAPAGTLELRSEIVRSLAEHRGIRVDPGRVIVTPGAKPIIFFTALALLEAGDEVICPDPGFPTYASAVSFTGARVVPLPLRAARRFQPDLDELVSLISPRTKLLILNTPHNPTGSMLEPETHARIAAIAQQHGLWVLADDIYADITFGRAHRSIAADPAMLDRTILVDGFSKTFAMTGWRLGFGVIPEPLVEAMSLLVTNSVSCSAQFVQAAGVAALRTRPPEVAAMVAEFRRRRDYLVAALNAVPGIRCPTPDGAFYVFPDVSGLERGTSADVARDLLDEAGVATLAGSSFGAHGEGHIRISYATSLERLREAIARIGDWVARR